MKTIILKWRTLSLHLFRRLSILGLVSVLMVSCGGDNEKKDNPTTAVVATGTSPVFGNGTAGSNGLSVWNSLKSQTQCTSGQGRMQDLTFSIQSSQYYQSNVVAGVMSQSAVSGTFQGSFSGKTGAGDLIFLSRVANGNTISYNIVLSLCVYREASYNNYNQYNQGQVEIIGPNANLQNFNAQYIQFQNTNCAVGAITGALITFISPNWANLNYGNGQVPLQFSSATGACY